MVRKECKAGFLFIKESMYVSTDCMHRRKFSTTFSLEQTNRGLEQCTVYEKQRNGPTLFQRKEIVCIHYYTGLHNVHYIIMYTDFLRRLALSKVLNFIFYFIFFFLSLPFCFFLNVPCANEKRPRHGKGAERRH